MSVFTIGNPVKLKSNDEIIMTIKDINNLICTCTWYDKSHNLVQSDFHQDMLTLSKDNIIKEELHTYIQKLNEDINTLNTITINTLTDYKYQINNLTSISKELQNNTEILKKSNELILSKFKEMELSISILSEKFNHLAKNIDNNPIQNILSETITQTEINHQQILKELQEINTSIQKIPNNLINDDIQEPQEENDATDENNYSF